MATDLLIAVDENVPRQKSRRFAVLRLTLAWIITQTVLPYAWCRTALMGMLIGWPEPLYAGVLAFGVLAVIGLTYGLSAASLRPGTRWFVGLGIAVPWVAIFAVRIAVAAGPAFPWPYAFLLFLPSTLWVAWVAWMFYLPLGWRTRLGTLLLLLAALAGSRFVLTADGLSGDARMNFALRGQETAGLGGTEPDADALPTRAAIPTQTGEQDYAQFLGPHRLGVLPQARLARDWKQSPPRMVWRTQVGAGWGAFAVAGDYAVTQEQRGSQECVVCYRVSDGARVWTHTDLDRFDSSMAGPGPRATPTIAGGRVYAVGATGLLNCLDGATGRRAWSVNILKDNDAENLPHGVCASPLIAGDLVIVSPTGKNGISLAAYHRETGKRVWRAGKDQASYGSPLLVELAGVPQVLLYNAEGVTAHAVAGGKVLWSYPWGTPERINCSQPIPNAGKPGQVFVATGYGKGSALFRAEKAGLHAWRVQTVWQSRWMQTKFTSAVLHQEFIYGLDNGILECLDLKTGKRRWKAGRYGHGQVLLAGDLLLVQAENGAVVLVEPAPEGLRELGRFSALTGTTWNNLVLAGKFLLVRNDREAACFELPLERDGRPSENTPRSSRP
jgi:outer membrane protein assembly factor BamB